MSAPEMEFDDDDDFDDDFCVDCGDTFRYDDCGGYNPPCACGLHCHRCHELARRDEDDDWDPRDDEDFDDPQFSTPAVEERRDA